MSSLWFKCVFLRTYLDAGGGPMIWLDGLDLPLYQAFPTNFAEIYAEERYPSE